MKPTTKRLTHERLIALLEYDPQTGYFKWLVKPNRKIVVGGRAGAPAERGYRHIGIDWEDYREHRLAWLYMTGRWPRQHIDHRNGVRNDNRFENLREASRGINAQNQRNAMSNNVLGLLGVTRGQNGRYRATISVKGKQRFLGEFATPLVAHAVYIAAKRQHHEGCTI